MSRTKKDLITNEIHRKAGPMKAKVTEPIVCPYCEGLSPMWGEWYGTRCPNCDNEGSVYES